MIKIAVYGKGGIGKSKTMGPWEQLAMDIKDRLNIDFELAYTNYWEEDILNIYKRLMEKLANKEEIKLDLEPYERKARQAVRIPLSILTAVIGAPVFILLLRKTEGGGV